jgi:SAM-dependent methyltransferase
MTDAEGTRRFFDAIASRYDRVFARPRDEMQVHMARLLDLLGPPRDVLDLGVGTGPELHHLLDAGHRVVGVDISPAMIAACSERARPIRCICGDFWSGLPAEDGAFDAVIALFGSLAHAPRAGAQREIGREVLRVLRPGGIFYAEVPAPAWAAQHSTFEDNVTGARIEIDSISASTWREALDGLEVAVSELGSELCIVGRRAV